MDRESFISKRRPSKFRDLKVNTPEGFFGTSSEGYLSASPTKAFRK